MFFNSATCPSGWSEYTALQGRYAVGLPSGGTLAGTKGKELSNLEDRAVGYHSHNARTTGDFGLSQDVRSGNTTPAAWKNTGNKAGITVDSAGTAYIEGNTNAPYIQLLACQKN